MTADEAKKMVNYYDNHPHVIMAPELAEELTMAQFIVAAVAEETKRIIKLLEEYAAELERLKSHLDAATRNWNEVITERDKLKAENERLKAELNGVRLQKEANAALAWEHREEIDRLKAKLDKALKGDNNDSFSVKKTS